MRKSARMLLAMATVISITAGNQFNNDSEGTVVYAASLSANTDESAKADFAYEMAQITAKLFAAPNTNVETFKVEYSYAIAKVTAKAMPMLPESQRRDFAYAMAQNTAKMLNDHNLNVERAKADFSYQIATLTAKVISGPTNFASAGAANSNATAGNLSSGAPSTELLRNNADIEPKAAALPKSQITAGTVQKANEYPVYIAPETYNGLINEIKHVGETKDNKVHLDGEVRAHYAFNNGPSSLDQDFSELRVRLGADVPLEKNWRAYGMVEGQKGIIGYRDQFKFSRLYATGPIGESKVTVGSFGYLMAEGNIYNSSFKGLRTDFGRPVKYTFSFGQTDETREMLIAAAQYKDYDYNLEAAAYQYQMNGTRNSIRTVSGNYNFSNIGVGAMVLNSSLGDSKGNKTGYVFSLNYGEQKSWRPGTYSIFAKYYNQPLNTYIAHDMNGRGGAAMNGFRGYGVGVSYTLADNLVAGSEYYNLTDKISGEKGTSWWNQLTHYF